MQDPSPTRSAKKSLATHGRTIHGAISGSAYPLLNHAASPSPAGRPPVLRKHYVQHPAKLIAQLDLSDRPIAERTQPQFPDKTGESLQKCLVCMLRVNEFLADLVLLMVRFPVCYRSWRVPNYNPFASSPVRRHVD